MPLEKLSNSISKKGKNREKLGPGWPAHPSLDQPLPPRSRGSLDTEKTSLIIKSSDLPGSGKFLGSRQSHAHLLSPKGWRVTDSQQKIGNFSEYGLLIQI